MVIGGERLGDPALVQELTQDGSSIEDWAKWATETHQSPSGNFRTHFCFNERTGDVDDDFDDKVEFSKRGAS